MNQESCNAGFQGATMQNTDSERKTNTGRVIKLLESYRGDGLKTSKCVDQR